MRRREWLQWTAGTASLAILPRDCHLPWSKAGKPLVGPTLTAPQRATVSAVADALLPRTATPGALDVNVPAFVDVIVAEHWGDDERALLADGMAWVDETANRVAGRQFADLRGDARERVMAALEAPADRTTRGARGYAQLRAVCIHGYFTSEVVQREVLKVEIMPGRFDGDAPRPRGSTGVAHG